MNMPDLQSELAKVLTQQQFDDDDGPAEAPATMSFAQQIWEYVKTHPTSNAKEVVQGTNIKASVVANALNKLYVRGLVTRRDLPGGYSYTASVDSYPVFDRSAHGKEMIQLAVAARKKNAKAAKAKPTAQPQPAPTAFDVDAIIGGLNVLQAKQLLVRLKEVFGV
jgi:hypothetical protein